MKHINLGKTAITIMSQSVMIVMFQTIMLVKWLTKAENGFHHSIAFTFKDIPVAIQAREISKNYS